jgi:hypothetical protein
MEAAQADGGGSAGRSGQAIRAIEIDDLEACSQALEQVQTVSRNGASAGWR